MTSSWITQRGHEPPQTFCLDYLTSPYPGGNYRIISWPFLLSSFKSTPQCSDWPGSYFWSFSSNSWWLWPCDWNSFLFGKHQLRTRPWKEKSWRGFLHALFYCFLLRLPILCWFRILVKTYTITSPATDGMYDEEADKTRHQTEWTLRFRPRGYIQRCRCCQKVGGSFGKLYHDSSLLVDRTVYRGIRAKRSDSRRIWSKVAWTAGKRFERTIRSRFFLSEFEQVPPVLPNVSAEK